MVGVIDGQDSLMEITVMAFVEMLRQSIEFG